MTSYDRETLINLVREHADAAPEEIEFVPITTGKHNRSFWVKGREQTYVLRVAPPDDAGFLFYEQRMMRQEPQLHRIIREKTDIPVADVIAYDFGRSVIDRDYLLMTALPGTPLSDVLGLTQEKFDRALYQVGKFLRQLHAISAEEVLDGGRKEYGYLGAHRPMRPASDWVTAFDTMWNKLLGDVEACGAYTKEEADRMRSLFATFRGRFEHPVEPILLHMDVWSQNILIDDDGNVTGLVDFDRALWGDVEIEYAVLDYCGISEPPFWEGYGLSRDTSDQAMARRVFYLLYEIQKYMPIEVWRRNNFSAAERYKQYSFDLASQLG